MEAAAPLVVMKSAWSLSRKANASATETDTAPEPASEREIRDRCGSGCDARKEVDGVDGIVARTRYGGGDSETAGTAVDEQAADCAFATPSIVPKR